MKCKYEIDDDCCNSRSGRYMCSCKMPCADIAPFTNLDHIRSMNPVELEKAIGGCGLCGYIQDHYQQWCDDMPDCSNCVVQWLEHPYGGAEA